MRNSLSQTLPLYIFFVTKNMLHISKHFTPTLLYTTGALTFWLFKDNAKKLIKNNGHKKIIAVKK
jgi:hypothetical protein